MNRPSLPKVLTSHWRGAHDEEPSSRADGASTIGHLDYLDGWRGLAILLVLAGHFLHISGSRLGVDVFFVLSGLLMSRILFETPISIRTFYQRRIARIFPVLLLFLLTVAIVAAFSAAAFPWAQMAYSALFVQAYIPEGDRALWLPIGHLWSLNVEEHSYVFLSLIAMCTRRRWIAFWTLGAAAAASAVMYRVHADLGVAGTWRTECAAFALLASAALRLLLRDFQRPGQLLTVAVLGFFGTILTSRLVGGSTFFDYVAKPFCLAAIVNTLHGAPQSVKQALSMRWLRWLGVASFSVYVWQQPFYHWVLAHRIPPLAGLSAAIVVGAASFYLFETPLRRAIRDWRPRRSRESAHPRVAAP